MAVAAAPAATAATFPAVAAAEPRPDSALLTVPMVVLNEAATAPAILMASWYSVFLPAKVLHRLREQLHGLHELRYRQPHEAGEIRVHNEGQVYADFLKPLAVIRP